MEKRTLSEFIQSLGHSISVIGTQFHSTFPYGSHIGAFTIHPGRCWMTPRRLGTIHSEKELDKPLIIWNSIPSQQHSGKQRWTNQVRIIVGLSVFYIIFCMQKQAAASR